MSLGETKKLEVFERYHIKHMYVCMKEARHANKYTKFVHKRVRHNHALRYVVSV